VVPTDTPALPTGPVALPDGMIDPIDQWNHDNDRVTGPMNARGWYPVTCPFEHEHTGVADHGADYKPGMPGVFKCQHEHRGRPPLTTAWYRSWILEQDPTADLSIMPRGVLEGLGLKLAAALKVQLPAPTGDGTPIGADEAGMQGGGPELKHAFSKAAFLALQEQLARSGLFPDPPFDIRSAILADLIHVASEDCYWSIETKCLVSHKTVDDRWFYLMLPSGMLDRHSDVGDDNDDSDEGDKKKKKK
jgi:hypothetical protein